MKVKENQTMHLQSVDCLILVLKQPQLEPEIRVLFCLATDKTSKCAYLPSKKIIKGVE